jgi:hypothetical protein
MWRACRLHADTYEEVEADPSSIVQATLVVMMASLSSAIGTWLRVVTGHPLPENPLPLPLHLLVIALEPLVVWLVGSVFTYMVGATFFKGPETETDYAEVLRTTGFAFAPGILILLAWVPPEPVALVLLLGIRLWILVAAVVALRQALDFTTLRAIGTFCVAVVLTWVLLWGLSVVPLPL